MPSKIIDALIDLLLEGPWRVYRRRIPDGWKPPDGTGPVPTPDREQPVCPDGEPGAWDGSAVSAGDVGGRRGGSKKRGRGSR